MRLRRLGVGLVALAIALLEYRSVAGGSVPVGHEHASAAFDGSWWLSSSSAEQLGFRDGLADCHLWEVKLKLPYDRSAQDDQVFITDFYRKNPRKLGVPVYEVFLKASDRPSPLGQSGGEHYDEAHGYWDGVWWKGWNDPERGLSQKGFVEGYLWCYREKSGSRRGTFSQTPDEYVKRITEWYEKTGADESKIADVLFKFRDLPVDRPRKQL